MASLTVAYRDILKHSSIYGLGQILRRLASVVLLPFYTHWLSPKEYGCIAILDLTAAALAVVIGSGVAAAVTRYHFQERHELRPRVWWTGLAVLAVLATAIVTLIWTIREPLARVVLGPQEVQGGYYFQLILIMLWSDGLGQVLEAYLRVRKWSTLVVGSSFVCLLLNVGLNVYFLGFLRLGVAGLLWGNLLTSLVYRTFQLAVFASHSSWDGIDWLLGARLLRFGSPLVLTALMSLIMDQADRYLLTFFVPLDQVGIYSLGYSIGQAINTLYFLPFTSIWGVLIYEIAEQKQAKKIYHQVFQYFVYGQMLIFLGVSLFAKPLLGLIAPRSFARAESIIPVVCLAYLFFSFHEHFKVPALLAKRTLSLLPAFITAAVVNILANLILIPLLGLQGAAWASVLSFAVFSFLGLWRYRLIEKYDYPLVPCGVILAGMIGSYLGARLLDGLDVPQGWLILVSGVIWLGWAALLFGRVVRRTALAGAAWIRQQRALRTGGDSPWPVTSTPAGSSGR